MRVEPHGAGSIVHVIKRGARGMEIVRDELDRKRFLAGLHLLNDQYKSDYWTKEIASLPPFTRPDHWPERAPLVDVLAWTLMPNHIHLILRVREDREQGISEFAQKLFRSMTGHFNEKYSENGSIFQGPYKSKTIDTDEYLRYLIPYVVVKNTFELYPAGLRSAIENFGVAWKWAQQYPYTSLGIHCGETVSPIIEHDVVREIFPTLKKLEQASRDMLTAYAERRDDLRALQLED